VNGENTPESGALRSLFGIKVIFVLVKTAAILGAATVEIELGCGAFFSFGARRL